jgi:hypothetical protein
MPWERVYSVVDPSVCVVAQGSKEFLLGEHHYRYDPFHYLLTTVGLPTISQVLEASHAQPFLSLRLTLDPGIVRSVMLEAGYASARTPVGVKGVDVSPLDTNLLEAEVRLTRLLNAPAEAPILLLLIMREIVYRLLMGMQGTRLRQNFDRPLRVEQLTRELGMNVSSFH